MLTPQLIRMEWSADGQFEDRATLTFVNRETPVPKFKVRESKSKLTITTPALTLTYLKNGKFSDKNLKAVFTLNGREVVWTPGMEIRRTCWARPARSTAPTARNSKSLWSRESSPARAGP